MSTCIFFFFFIGTRNILRVFKHHNALHINQIILNKISTRNYCEQISTLNNISTQLANEKEKPSSDVNPNSEIDVSTHVIDINSFTLTKEEEIEIKKYDKDHETSVLEPYEKDVSHLNPILPATETFARYANHSESIQMLADLGVHMYKWEGSDKIMNLILNLDREQLKKYIL